MLEIWGRRNSGNAIPVMFAVGELGLNYKRHDVGGSEERLGRHAAAQDAQTTERAFVDDGDIRAQVACSPSGSVSR